MSANRLGEITAKLWADGRLIGLKLNWQRLEEPHIVPVEVVG